MNKKLLIQVLERHLSADDLIDGFGGYPSTEKWVTVELDGDGNPSRATVGGRPSSEAIKNTDYITFKFGLEPDDSRVSGSGIVRHPRGESR